MEDVKDPCDENKMDVPSSSSSKDLSKTLPEEAFNHFLQGKRNMLVKDYQFAAQSLGTACELYVKHFGELAIECGEVYFMYGKALFRLSQQQAGVLGGALNDAGSNEDDNSSESESKENESEKNSEDGEEGGEGSGDNEKEETEKEPSEEEKEPSESTDSPQAVVDESNETKDETNETKDESSSKTPAEVNTDSSKDESNKDKSGAADEKNAEEDGDENQEAEEDLDDLELAWNTLETAKSIFQRQNTVESQLKVAEILELLAEINMESDNNALAINDLKECLKIQKEHLKPDDRILAETYYQMGLALLLDKQYFDAIDNFGMTTKILEVNLENLKNTPVDDKSDGTFASADKELEIAELEKILHDIQEKVEDTEELIRNAKKELENVFISGAAVVASPVKENKESSTTVKPTSNITHLLKRKKPDDAASEGGSKRIKLISVPNGKNKAASPEEFDNADEKV